ncbi:diguanylate cyclase [Pseudohongiella sp.]|uniref:GGDEF domain-containing protein n=1 Tax=marine sediment metagenome TaxID=412755 RepID=A0A0F9Z4C5_9ZZZZ|nr:diguanylate cyclase [Pseudohongiella sp.]
MSKLTENKAAPGGPQELNSPFHGLGIRNSFLVGFATMALFMVIVMITALGTSANMSRSVSHILDDQLPVMLVTVRAARAADALASSGLSLIAVRSDADRALAFRRVASAQQALDLALDELTGVTDTQAATDVITLVTELNQNLQSLTTLVNERLSLLAAQQRARNQLISTLQAFQQELTFRVRILESDSDVINALVQRPSPPVEQIARMSGNTAPLIPLSRFYAEVEAIGGLLLAATQDPTLTALAVSEQTINQDLQVASETLEKLPSDVSSAINSHFGDLRAISQSPDGMVGLRQRELTLLNDGEALNEQNRQIIARVDSAIDALVETRLSQFAQASDMASSANRDSQWLLLIISAAGLTGLVAFFYLHVLHHLVPRLTGLGETMLGIAAGRYDVPMPAEGRDELGRLGSAVHQFRRMAMDASQREEELQASKQKAEDALNELEQKASELEQLNNKLETLTLSDALTGLANRRHFDEVLSREWVRSTRSKQSMAVLMLDVDYFKRYNDQYGHQQGDECLRRIAGVLQARVQRETDLAARYGGEEFSIVLSSCTEEHAASIAEQIRAGVESLQIPHDNSEYGVVSVSIGVATLVPAPGNTADELLRKADVAMYNAKHQGRNRVMCAEPCR